MDTATILRSSRRASLQSQRGLARASGTAQPAICDLENGVSDATVGRLNRLLSPLGAQVAALPTSLPTIGSWAAAFRRWLAEGDEAEVRSAFIRLADNLRSVDPDVRVALCTAPPESTGSDGFDAALASTVEFILESAGLPVPRWATEVGPSPEPLYLVTNQALRGLIEEQTPAVFARRNVYVPADFFASI